MRSLQSKSNVRRDCAHTSKRLRIQTLLALTLCLLGSSAQAQVAEPRPTVTRALDLILDYPQRVPLGTDVVFRQKASESGRALIQSGVQARVFSLREGESKPTPITTVGDCDVYLSVVHRLKSTPDHGLRFVRVDHGWINLTNSEQSTKDGRWFLVFEQIGAPQEHFRIKTSDATAYFGTGFVVTVYDNGSIPFAQIKAEYDKRRGGLARLYEEVDSTDSRIPCYSYRGLRASFEGGAVVAYGEVESCANSARLRMQYDARASSGHLGSRSGAR